MSVRITIIGLGQIGGSFGLALADQKELFLRVGHDKEPEVARLAQKLGAVDQVSINLPASVRDSDVILLALPIDQIRETIEIIAPDLKEDVVVLDTAPVKEVVTAWAKELLPTGRYYVGLTPVLNPSYLLLPEGMNDEAEKRLRILTPGARPGPLVRQSRGPSICCSPDGTGRRLRARPEGSFHDERAEARAPLRVLRDAEAARGDR